MKFEPIEITTEFIPLDALLKFAGFAETGGQAKLLIAEGLVFVNGEKCDQRKKKIVPGDKLTLEEYGIEVIRRED